MNSAPTTAAAAGLIGCPVCGLVSRLGNAPRGAVLRCPRCNTHVHSRKPNSLGRTWALIVAAVLCYFPANMLPILHSTTLGRTDADTILSGIAHFIEAGDWLLAVLIFTASVVVPLSKLFVLAYLLVSVQRGTRWRPRDRTRLFRFVEIIGPWSMLDVFVVTVLVALVKIESLANIEPGAGAVFFCAVVVLTMFAALTFDSRLIWDATESNHVRRTHAH